MSWWSGGVEFGLSSPNQDVAPVAGDYASQGQLIVAAACARPIKEATSIPSLLLILE